MSDAVERKPFTIYNLIPALEEYINRNRHSCDADDRWFATLLDVEVLPRARRVRSGGLNEDERNAVRQFRLAEIEKEKADKQREIDRLDVEAKNIKTA